MPADDDGIRLEILRSVPGRALLAEPDGGLYIGRGYEILRSKNLGESWARVTLLPTSPLRRVAQPMRLARRLLRQEIRSLLRLSDGSYIAASREGVFHGNGRERIMHQALLDECDVPPAPPMCLAVGPNDTVLWGEYSSKRSNELVRILASTDRGHSYHAVHSFPSRSVRHIHNIVYDTNRDHYWVMTGDYDEEAGIGMLSSDFSKFEWLVRGAQRYRTTNLFDLGNALLFATDTDIEPNRFVILDKSTGTFEEFGNLPGSCIYTSRFGDYYVISTSVEPSNTNLSNWATLWISEDGRHWSECFRARKDWWHPRYFQFGSIVLPKGQTTGAVGFFSGQALVGIDDTTLIVELKATPIANGQREFHKPS